MKKLSMQFYGGRDVVKLAAALLGKLLVTRFGNELTIGRIVETEAYIGLTDKASHSFGGRRTARNEHMYAAGGTAYVYICYGMHHLFNVVTNKKGIPDAVLIRALEPVEGIPLMLKRTGKMKADTTLTRGPGNAAKAMGIAKMHSGILLNSDELFIADDGYLLPKAAAGSSGRIGVEGAGKEAAALPYRFYIRGNPYVSGSPTK